MTPEPTRDEIVDIDTPVLEQTTEMKEMIRNKIGLVNLIAPPRPQPKKPQRVIRQGGSAARKILKGQR